MSEHEDRLVEAVAEAIWDSTGGSSPRVPGINAPAYRAEEKRREARVAIAAMRGDGLEALLVRLTDSSLPGRDVRIARNDDEWLVAQEYCGLDEAVPTGVGGNGPTLRAAVEAALGEDAK